MRRKIQKHLTHFLNSFGYANLTCVLRFIWHNHGAWKRDILDLHTVSCFCVFRLGSPQVRLCVLCFCARYSHALYRLRSYYNQPNWSVFISYIMLSKPFKSVFHNYWSMFVAYCIYRDLRVQAKLRQRRTSERDSENLLWFSIAPTNSIKTHLPSGFLVWLNREVGDVSTSSIGMNFVRISRTLFSICPFRIVR